ncbi:hypothetical protein EVAR_25355_1 [Eumeta japonica]|uniref:Uncharacterized protein n=1 Tax=Eumeta variegata TaxID=151549 RepID=A0A4C1Y065_EUMVA|nr:hypothetical protein EVAR_25355_1 [Eumeta japonica]
MCGLSLIGEYRNSDVRERCGLEEDVHLRDPHGPYYHSLSIAGPLVGRVTSSRRRMSSDVNIAFRRRRPSDTGSMGSRNMRRKMSVRQAATSDGPRPAIYFVDVDGAVSRYFTRDL